MQILYTGTVDSERNVSPYTLSFSITNDTKSPITKASLGWTDYDKEPIGGLPIDFPARIAPGKTAKVVFKEKVRVVKAYIKWFEGSRRQLIEMERVPGFGYVGWPYYYFIEFNLIIDPLMGPRIGKMISAPIPPN